MVDRFGSQVIRSGAPKTTPVRVAENSTPDFSLIFRIRYMVGEQTQKPERTPGLPIGVATSGVAVLGADRYQAEIKTTAEIR